MVPHGQGGDNFLVMNGSVLHRTQDGIVGG